MSEIVVGLDLSPSAGDALKWAAEQARARGQILRAVHAVDVSPDWFRAPLLPQPHTVSSGSGSSRKRPWRR
jgi:Universal stress protein family